MAPLGMVAMADPCGGFPENAQEYYIERAKGGTWLIITGITNVNYNEMPPLLMLCATYQPLMFARSCAPTNERNHAYDAMIFLQLSGGFGRAAIPQLITKAIAPSDQENRWDPSIHHQAMTVDEIKKLIASEDFLVSLRYSLKVFIKSLRHATLPGEKFEEKGKDIAKGVEAAKILVEDGFDKLNVDAGTDDWRPGWLRDSPLAASARKKCAYC